MVHRNTYSLDKDPESKESILQDKENKNVDKKTIQKDKRVRGKLERKGLKDKGIRDNGRLKVTQGSPLNK